MECNKVIKLINTTLATCMLFATQAGYADAPAKKAATIEDGSMDWGDAAARTRLLAVVPKWSPQTLRTIYDEYNHPERHHFPIFINGAPVNYNALFINALWGPYGNPFVKYPRPAKVFIFIKNTDGTKKYFMAPIVQNENDKNYYVFERMLFQPTPLKEWVYKLTDGFPCAVRFNVCTGYGVLPTDTCEGKTYEGELYRDPQIHDAKGKLIDTTIQSTAPSAIRKDNQDWREKAKSMRPAKNVLHNGILDGSSPWSDKVKRDALLRSAVTWPNYSVIKANFEKIRNMRYFQDEVVPNFGRRITWLYPDDGCWTRAAAVIKDFFGPLNNVVNNYPRPSKVFVFGNLCVNTNNSPNGRASWWYHFAPIVRDAETNQTYVLDPSVNAAAPSTVESWVAAISATTGSCAQTSSSVSTFNICNGYGTSPFERCEFGYDVNFEGEIRSVLLQKWFRRYERDRQVQLGRDPNKVLGDTPPWLTNK